MQEYEDKGGNSGIRAYQIEMDSITVEFSDGSIYMYDYNSAGAENVEHMKLLAKTGQGLNSYISRHVKNDYAQKLK